MKLVRKMTSLNSYNKLDEIIIEFSNDSPACLSYEKTLIMVTY